MKRIIIITILALTAFRLSAQNQSVTFRGEPEVVTVGDEIHINYEIVLPYGLKWCEVALFLSTDGGRNFLRKPLKSVGKDVGRITSSGRKTIVWQPLKEKNLLDEKENFLTFEIRVVNNSATGHKDITKKDGERWSTLVSTSLSPIPQLSYGLMVGAAKTAGFYLKFRSNFVTTEETYQCNSDLSIDDREGTVWTSGEYKRTRMAATGGVLVRTIDMIYLYAGAGYGTKKTVWEDMNNQWALVNDLSAKGLNLDVGVIFKLDKLALILGASTTGFKYTEFEAGLGFMF